MRVLITGSSSFIGRNLAESLALNGHTILAPSKSELDLAKSDDVNRYFGNNFIDVIVHCATTRTRDKIYPPETCENNLRMFFNLQEHASPSVRMINLGSGAEYGRKHWRRKMPEEYFGEHIPEDSLGYSKYLISKYIRDANGGNLVCLRLFGVFGKYEDYCYRFISNAIVKSLLGMPIVINQNVVFDYLYVADLCRIIECLINRGTIGIFNVTPTESIDLVTAANIVNKISGNGAEIRVLNQGIGAEYSGDNKKLLSEIGDFKFTSYETAIEELYEYYVRIKDSLDADAVKRDLFLDYAKELRREYFVKDA